MNCLDFRRQCSIDPRSTQAEFIAHKRECPGCEAHLRELETFERSLAGALRVPIPEGLSARVVVKQALTGTPRSSRSRLPWGMAAAASLLLAVTIGLLALRDPAPGIEQAVTGALIAEAEADHELSGASDEQIAAVMQPLGIDLSGALPGVRLVKPCTIRERPGAYLVVDGERGPVRVLIMPSEDVDGTIPFVLDGQDGLVFPCPRGSMAVIGAPDERLVRIEERIMEALNWS